MPVPIRAHGVHDAPSYIHLLESQQEDTGAVQLQNSCFISAQLEMRTQNERTRQVSGLGVWAARKGFF